MLKNKSSFINGVGDIPVIDLHFDESLIFCDLKAKDQEEVLKVMGNHLYEKNFVKESFIDAIIEREKTFPTGLPTSSNISVAIPHTDSVHVNKKAISLAILKDAVEFGIMGEQEAKTPVKIVFLLAIDKQNSHLKILQKLISIFQNEDVIKFLTTEKNKTLIKTKIIECLDLKEMN